MEIRNRYDNGQDFREAKVKERIRKVVLAGNKRPRLSMYLEELFFRDFTGDIRENRMEQLHQIYSWLSHER